MENHKPESDYVAPRKQLKRMARIVALLKQGDKTMTEIQADLESSSQYGTTDITGSGRTVRRDMEILRREYHCPIAYEPSLHCYVLHNKCWEFTIPAILNNNELLAIVIGGKLSKDIFPPSVSRPVEDAVDEVLRCNNTNDFISSGRLGSLKILNNTEVTVSEEIFSIVFNAWQNRHRLLIHYHNSRDETASRVIEPHALVFYDMQWSLRAYCPDSDQWRTYLVSRITAAFQLEQTFTPSQKAIDKISPDNYYDFACPCGVSLKLTRRGLQFAKAHLLRSNQAITPIDAESFILSVPEISVEEMLRWTLSQVPGDAIPVEPPLMVNEFRKALDKLRNLLDQQEQAKTDKD